MKESHNKVKKYLNKCLNRLSGKNRIKSIVYFFIILVTAIWIFQTGEFVGFRKAQFNCNLGKYYSHNFAPHHPRNRFKEFKGDVMNQKFTNAYGANGRIIKVELPQIVVEDIDNTEKLINITSQTKIIEQRRQIIAPNLETNEFVVVIGSPNSEGQIDAKLIRVMPVPRDIFRSENIPDLKK